VDVIVVNSRYSSKIVENLYDRKVEYVHLGVDIDEFKPGIDSTRIRRKLGYRSDEKIIICPGPFRPPKYLEVALKAFPTILKEVSNAQLLLVGSGPYLHKYLRLTEKMRIQENVKIISANPDEMPLYYSLGDVIVHPSYGEPFGLVPLEAMACGKPVVASNVGGTVEVIENGVSGLLVKNTPPAFATAIIRILSDTVFSEKLGREGRRAATKFTWREAAEKLLKTLYSAVHS
jgi:glycosyltransferase involved in cell wall biosynthesis